MDIAAGAADRGGQTNISGAKLDGRIKPAARSLPVGPRQRATGATHAMSSLLRRAATKSAFKVDCRRQRDGSMAMTIQTTTSVVLTWPYADLILLLSTTPAELNGCRWRTTDHVISRLGQGTTGRFGRHSLRTTIRRLRRILFEAGINPFLLHTNPRRGVGLMGMRPSGAVETKREPPPVKSEYYNAAE